MTKKILKTVDESFPSLVKILQTLIRQPSVSAKGQGIKQCANLVKKTLEQSGIHSEILYIKGAAPLVYGEVRSKTNPDKTLLFYNHYDVQPAEPFDLWNDPPFSGVKKGNKVYGRGASDDKGELVTRIKAVEAHLKATGDVPCTVKFVIEGEEEIGSQHISQYLTKYKKKFSCDGVIWEFGYVDSKDRPVISLGLKGLLYVELQVHESKMDLHSSLAAIIQNPAWRLVQAIHTLRDDDGNILIDGWYDDVRKLTIHDKKILESEPFDAQSFKKEFGVSKFVGDKKGLEAKTALAAGPTCNIAGFTSGYDGPGSKTVLPASAAVKIDFRLVPDMNPKKQILRLKQHLKSHGFSDVRVIIHNAEAAQRTDPADPFVNDVIQSANESFGKSVLNISNSGTGPMHAFAKILGAPCIAIGSTHVFAKIHSPNEYARLDLLKKTCKCMCLILEKFGAY